MQYCLCMMPFLEVTILFNQHLHYRGEYRGKIPDGHSNPIYSVLKLLKLQNVWCIFRPSRVFHVYGTANMQNMHVNCKQLFPWTISPVMICRKMQHRIVIFKMQNIQYLPKNMLMISKKNMINQPWQNIGKMQHRLCIMPFLEVTILFNQHFHYRGEYHGTIPDGHSNPICF